MTAPETFRTASPVITKATTFPQVSIANSATANHHAHRRRRSNPNADAHVPAASARRNTPAGHPMERNNPAPGLLSSHNRSNSGLGNSKEIPTTAAITVAANRNAATTGMVFGRGSIADVQGSIARERGASPLIHEPVPKGWLKVAQHGSAQGRSPPHGN